MKKSDIPFLSATELSQLIKSKEVSPVEAVEGYLERISQVDSKINSYITVCGEEALEEARHAEQAIARGGYLGPMHGIPYGVKDQIYSKWIRHRLPGHQRPLGPAHRGRLFTLCPPGDMPESEFQDTRLLLVWWMHRPEPMPGRLRTQERLRANLTKEPSDNDSIWSGGRCGVLHSAGSW